MNKKKILGPGLLAGLIGVLCLSGWVIANDKMSNKIFEFEIGKTLAETSAQTRLPLSGDNTHGLITARSPSFPDGVYGKYAKPGFEILVGPLPSIMFFSDTPFYPNKIANHASLSIDGSQGLNTHARIYDHVYSLVSQFQQGKWQRYFPDECPRLSGKDSFIHYKEVDSLVIPELQGYVKFECPIDPAYKPELEQWKKMADSGYFHMWHDGQGTVAKLEVSVAEEISQKRGTPVLTRIDLEFELEDSINKRNAYNREYDLKDKWGDRIPKVEAEKRRIRAILEQRAQKTSDASTTANDLLRVTAGNPCPRTGIWQSQDVQSLQRRYEEGEIMADLHSAYGLTVWKLIG